MFLGHCDILDLLASSCNGIQCVKLEYCVWMLIVFCVISERLLVFGLFVFSESHDRLLVEPYSTPLLRAMTYYSQIHDRVLSEPGGLIYT